MNRILGRAIATAAAVVLYGWINFLLHPVATIASADVAGQQFANTDASYVTSMIGIRLFGNLGIPAVVLLAVVVAIWWRPLRQWWVSGAAAIVFGVLLAAPQAQAYYDKTDYTEAYTILPNESAFWIPDAGANKDNQAQFDSEAYLQANKIAVKRFIVPHTKLQGSGSFFDFYVPAGRLIIVDRTPFSREWVEARERGTSTRNESFPCQSKEGLNISVGVSIGASVLEPNAAKYLYRFGVLPPVGDRTDPKVIFNSVFFSRKLSDVMDDVGRKKVQTLVCNEIASRSFDKANEEANQIMDAVGKAAADYFASVGITLDFIGWADTFTFDPVVQDAVNRRYIASQDQAIAAELAPYASTIQALAAADALRSFGHKSDGRLPSTIVGLPPDLGGLLGTLLRSGAAAPTAPAAH
ncbi:MAG TPA: SPFH domain-containing protein [Acetobacteraceae bacterium]|nr:SPFH domain-containing protein [Acetobacteraceae bacterium]